MKHTWILVANAYQARLFEQSDRAGSLASLQSYTCPEARLKGVDLETDTGGYEEMGHGRGSSSFSDRAAPRAKVHEEFARKLARHLNDGIAAHLCSDLLIVASSPFLGIVKAHLDEQAAKHLRAAMARDMTELEPAAIAQQLREFLPRTAAQ